jgi:ribosomal protein S27E
MKNSNQKEEAGIYPGDFVVRTCPDCGDSSNMQYAFSIGEVNYFECLSCGGDYTDA